MREFYTDVSIGRRRISSSWQTGVVALYLMHLHVVSVVHAKPQTPLRFTSQSQSPLYSNRCKKGN